MAQPPLVISTQASSYFARKIAREFDTKILPTTRIVFGGAEHYYRLGVNNFNELLGRDVILVGSTHSDKEVNEIYRIGCALSGYGAKRIIFCLPFFGYSTMERAVKPGEVVTAKINARMLSQLPHGDVRNCFLMLDLHTSGLVHYFEGECLRFELYAESVLTEAVKKLNLSDS